MKDVDCPGVYEYLIEQVQREEKTAAKTSFKLNFSHPVKELVWTTAAVDYTSAKLTLNGNLLLKKKNVSLKDNLMIITLLFQHKIYQFQQE